MVTSPLHKVRLNKTDEGTFKSSSARVVVIFIGRKIWKSLQFVYSSLRHTDQKITENVPNAFT